jgi:hypothetical protein
LGIKKGLPYGNPFEYIFQTKTGLPYDFSLSHHQLLFNALVIICATNMEIVFPKSKGNDKFG